MMTPWPIYNCRGIYLSRHISDSRRDTLTVLADLPARRDPPAAFDLPVATVPDFVVQVDRRADMAWYQPDLLSDARRPTDLHVTVLLVQFAHSPWTLDEVGVGSGADSLIAGKSL